MCSILSSSIIAADVAYVVEDSHKVDLMTWTALEDMDLEIEIITNDMIMNTDFTEYSFILIGAGKLKNVMSMNWTIKLLKCGKLKLLEIRKRILSQEKY